MKTTALLSALLLGTSMVCNGQWSYANLSEPKCDIGSATLGNKVYFAGGGNANGPLKTVETYDVITGEQVILGSLSVGRGATRGVACGSKVLFAGGWDSKISYATVDVYDTLTRQWIVEQLSVDRLDLAAVSHGNKVLFAGGVQYPSMIWTDVVDIYDIQTGVWSTAKLSVPREGIAASVVGDLAIFAGGLSSTTTSVIDIYNFATNTWSTSALSQARGMAIATTVGDKVIIAGGITSLNVPTDRVDIYDAVTGRITLANLSVPRSWEGNAATVNGKAYFAGGGTFMGNNFYGLSNVIDIYNPATESWSVDYLTNALVGHSFVGIGNYLIVAGGVNAGSEFVSKMEIFYDKPKCQLRSLTLSSQTEVDNFATDYPYCQEIGVDVTISGSDIKNVSGLSMMSAIAGAFTIQNNPLLTSLEGLEGVTTLWGDLVIEGNPSLKSLKGLKNIDPGSISNLTISDNDSLSICEVLSVCSYLASPGGSIDIQGNSPGCNSQEEIKLACLTSSGNIKLENEITIYPNPGKGLLVISAPNEIAIELVAIYNSAGQKVHQEKPVNNSVDISKLRPGMYFIEIRSNQLNARRKFVVE